MSLWEHIRSNDEKGTIPNNGRSWDELSEFERMTWVVSYTEAAVEIQTTNDSEK